MDVRLLLALRFSLRKIPTLTLRLEPASTNYMKGCDTISPLNNWFGMHPLLAPTEQVQRDILKPTRENSVLVIVISKSFGIY